MAEEKFLVAVNHTHPSYSNRTQEEYLGLPGTNHQADYLELAERLPENFDLAFTVSNHFATEGIEFWEDLKDEVERNGGEAFLDDIVFRGEYEGTRIWGLHSVEAAYEDNLDHEYLMHGLPLDDEGDRTYEDTHSLMEASEAAEIGTLPHPYFMDYNWGEEKRDDFFDIASDYDAELSLEYSQGYGLLNRWANRGLSPVTDNLGDLQEEHEVPAVPGVDWHAYLSDNIALMDRSAIDSLEEDEFPLEEFKDMSVVKESERRSRWPKSIRNTAGSMATFGGMLPLIGPSMPDSEEFMQKLRDWSLEAYEGLDAETVSENAVRVNGKNGILSQEF